MTDLSANGAPRPAMKESGALMVHFSCDLCGTRAHRECGDQLVRCPSLGCAGVRRRLRPPARRLLPLLVRGD